MNHITERGIVVTTTTNLTKNRHQGRAGGRVDIIGVHTMEVKELPQTAENVANNFKNLAIKASAHWCVDNNSRVRSVNDGDTAWTLPGANSRSLNLELAGYAKQTPEDWADAYSIDMLEIAALCAAEWVIKYGIPIRRLTDEQIRNKEKGFAGHVDVNRVYKESTHWDPGPAFPWDYFLQRVQVQVGTLGGITVPAPPKPVPTYDNKGYSTAYIRARQEQLRQVGYKIDADGVRGPATIAATVDFQTKHGLDPDGIPGPSTAKKLNEVLAVQKPSRPNCTALQAAVRAAQDNVWGPDTDKRFDAVREASRWGGNDFPYGVGYVQQVVGTFPDDKWGKNSAAAHDKTVYDIQVALKAMGYDPGDLDSRWGPSTEAAYQSARKACRA